MLYPHYQCRGLSELSSFLFYVKGSRILMTEKDLNGTARVAVDGMATEEECKMLIKLAEVCSSFFSPLSLLICLMH